MAAGLVDHDKLRQRYSRGPMVRRGPTAPQMNQAMLQHSMGNGATPWRDHGSVNALPMSVDPRRAAAYAAVAGGMAGLNAGSELGRGPVSGLSKRQQRFAKTEPDEESRYKAESEISKAVGELEHMERESMRAKAWGAGSRGEEHMDDDDTDDHPAALSAFGQRQKQIDMAHGLAGRFRTRPGMHSGTDEEEDDESDRAEAAIKEMDRLHDPLQRSQRGEGNEDDDEQDGRDPDDTGAGRGCGLAG